MPAEHRSEHHTWEPGPLAPFVDRISGYRMSGYAAGVHVGMPAPALTLVVPVGEPLVVAGPDGVPTAYAGVVGGLTDRPVTIHHDGTQHGIELAVTPAGARALLGRPAGEVDVLVGLDDVLAPADRRLSERLVDADGWDDRVALVLTALSRRLDDGPGPRPEVAHAWAEISRTHGRVPVRTVASAVGWSTRHLTEQFRREYGLGPKTAARVTRFDRSRTLLQRGRPLAEVALTCGYADQAHLNREWREYAGVSPTAWARDDELAFVQDGEAAGVPA